MKLKKYDDETLKHLQKIELMILKDFIKLCEMNNIDYSLYGGSILGAVRHNGFIPWDDDIDVIVLQKDYEKLINIMEQNLDGKYKFINMNNNQDYFLFFSKIMINNTEFEEWWSNQVNYKQGIYIDIFILHDVPNNKIKRFYQVKMARLYSKLFTIRQIKLKHHPPLIKLISNSIHNFLKIIRISPNFFKKRGWDLLSKYKNENSELVCDITALNHPQIYKKSDFFPTIKHEFEGVMVNIPNNSDSILTQIYGDYMQLPPENKRYNHAPENIDFGKY